MDNNVIHVDFRKTTPPPPIVTDITAARILRDRAEAERDARMDRLMEEYHTADHGY